MDPVIFIHLFVPEVEPLAGFSDHTALLTATHRFRTHVVLGFCAPTLTKGPDVAGIFNDVPALNGEWTLEIALELPDLLPTLGAKSEAVVAARDAAGTLHEICLSNRMSRFHYLDANRPYQVLAPRTEAWHGAAQVTGDDGAPKPAAEEQLRTVASMRFQVKGADAESAFEGSVRSSIECMFGAMRSVLEAARECREGFTPTARTIRWDHVSYVYVLLSGDGKASGARLALSGGRVSLNTDSLEGQDETRFRAIADGTIPSTDIDRLLGEARSSWQDGEYEFAFLQAVISAEIATSRLVRAVCLRRGVSKNKLDNSRKEMTYSWALNVGLALCISEDRRPSQQLISAMNSARNKRNDLMHEAAFDMNRETVGQVLSDTAEFIAALRVAEQDDAADAQATRQPGNPTPP